MRTQTQEETQWRTLLSTSFGSQDQQGKLCNGGRRTNTVAATGGVHNATVTDATTPTAPDINTNHKSSSHQLHLVGPKKKKKMLKKILQVRQKHFSHVDIDT